MKRLSYRIMTLLMVAAWIPNGSMARSIHVGPECPVRCLQQAIDMACDGDTIRLARGVYQEWRILVDKPLVILGENYPVLDAMGQGEIMTIVSDHVQVIGLHFRNTGRSHIQDRAAIRTKRVKHFDIRDNLVELAYFAIYLEHSREGRVRGNRIQGTKLDEANSGNGIHLWYCKQIDLEDNHIFGHRDGIYLEFADSSRIRGNLAENNIRYGLHFMFSNDDEYYRNTFRHNGAGVAVMFSRRINMWENTFALNWGKASYGLLLKEIYDADIRHNSFRENTIGIFVEGSNRVHYTGNTFHRNGWAIKMAGGCLENQVSDNNFIANTFDLAMHSGANNSFDGNFWSAYDGYDLDRDGFGDVPYQPVKLFNYIVHQTPEAMILLRSLFVDLLNLSERVSPVFTPKNVADNRPLMRPLTLPSSQEITSL
jgi:nitrous oxidase accessory protein